MHPKVLLEACTDLVRLALKFDHPADAIVSRFFRDHRGLGPRERATLAETVYAVLRKKLLFEHMAPSGSGPRERRLAILGFADVLDQEAMRRGASSVKPSENGGKAGAKADTSHREFLRAALTDQERQWLDQCEQINPKDLLERHQHNLPDWLVAPLKEQLGAGFWPMVESLQRGAGLDLRVNELKARRPDVQKTLAKAGIVARPTPYSPWGLRIDGKPALNKLDAFVQGEFEVQDEGSQLLALLLEARRGEMVVDFCAGAGGKTLAVGAAMRSTGRLYAFDTSAHRLDALKPRLARSGLSNVHPAAIAHERDDRIKRLAGKIDRVLVDAPCSGLGTLRRNPDLKWRQSPKAIEEMTQKQAAILQGASKLLKSGGRLVYATCSVLPAENEHIAQAFSLANPDFEPLSVASLLEGLKVPDGASLCASGSVGSTATQSESLKVDGLYLRLWPHLHSTDGFFAAVWQRK